MKRNSINVQLVMVLVLAIFLVIFTLQNSGHVSIKLFFWPVNNIPLALLIISCLLIGYLLPYLILIPKLWKLKSELNRSQKENEKLQVANQANTEARLKPDPEGIAFDDEEVDFDTDGIERNPSNRFFKE